MTERDATLDAFAERNEGAATDRGPAPERDAAETCDGDDATEPGTDESVVEPAAATFAWSPDGAPCDACGATVERRWRAAEPGGGDAGEAAETGGGDAGEAAETEGADWVCGDCVDWARDE